MDLCPRAAKFFKHCTPAITGAADREIMAVLIIAAYVPCQPVNLNSLLPKRVEVEECRTTDDDADAAAS